MRIVGLVMVVNVLLRVCVYVRVCVRACVYARMCDAFGELKVL